MSKRGCLRLSRIRPGLQRANKCVSLIRSRDRIDAWKPSALSLSTRFCSRFAVHLSLIGGSCCGRARHYEVMTPRRAVVDGAALAELILAPLCPGHYHGLGFHS